MGHHLSKKANFRLIRSWTLLLLRLLPLFLSDSFALVFPPAIKNYRLYIPCVPTKSSPCGPSTSQLAMGLYDDLLPPRPTPTNSEDANVSDEDNENSETEDTATPIALELSEPLFSFDPKTGKETQNRLPPLGRRLDLGIDCYFEASDRKVQNLVDKTNCRVDDAAWALEACKGDVTEAWTRISVARRLALERQRQQQQTAEDDDEWDSLDIYQEFEKRKTARKEQDRKRSMQNFFGSSEKDVKWFPGKENPKPIDDEPWFTG
jgi:hypothetical protein